MKVLSVFLFLSVTLSSAFANVASHNSDCSQETKSYLFLEKASNDLYRQVREANSVEEETQLQSSLDHLDTLLQKAIDNLQKCRDRNK